MLLPIGCAVLHLFFFTGIGSSCMMLVSTQNLSTATYDQKCSWNDLNMRSLVFLCVHLRFI